MADLYEKYIIQKRNGEPIDLDAQYFVLRIDADRHARTALSAYADSVRVEDPEFASDLDSWVRAVTPEGEKKIKPRPKPTSVHVIGGKSARVGGLSEATLWLLLAGAVVTTVIVSLLWLYGAGTSCPR